MGSLEEPLFDRTFIRPRSFELYCETQQSALHAAKRPPNGTYSSPATQKTTRAGRPQGWRDDFPETVGLPTAMGVPSSGLKTRLLTHPFNRFVLK